MLKLVHKYSIALLLLLTGVISKSNNDPKSKSNGFLFVENKGQISDQFFNPNKDVLFAGRDEQLIVFLKANGLSYQLYNVESYRKSLNLFPYTADSSVSIPDKINIHRIDIEWLNIRSDVKVSGLGVSNDYINYYLSKSPVLNVKSYSEVLYEEIYDGINLIFKQADHHMKYDYMVNPHYDYKKIQFKINGAKNVFLDEKGNLIIETPLGAIVEGAPIVFQEGKKLSAKWELNDNIVSFDITGVDNRFPLLIDPVLFRQWGTYYGDAGYDVPGNVFSDKNGFVYMNGFTSSFTKIATVGSFQSTLGGNYDGFIVKFDSMGVRQWATYIGGSGDDAISSVKITNTNNLYLVGHTTTFNSSAFATPGCHQPNFNGGTYDAFLARFDANGIRRWSTYYGGSGLEYGMSCAFDMNENIFLSGQTTSNGTTIATPGSHQPLQGLGSVPDCYLVKFDSSGTRIWGTFYGGSQIEMGGYCATDKFGNVYLSGSTETYSGTTIATPGSHQPTIGVLFQKDAFIAKFNSLGVRQWGTYYGGASSDNGGSCATDTLGNVYMIGTTTDTVAAIFSTPSGHQTFNAGGQDGFLVKFNGAGLRQWGTFYGGNGSDYLQSLASTPSGEIYLFGTTNSSLTAALVTSNAYQYNYGGGVSDAFMAKISSNCTRQWGSYYGGSLNENGFAGNYNDYGKVFLAGNTDDFFGNSIATTGSHQPTGVGGPMDGMLIQFYNCKTIPIVTSNSVICTGQSATISAIGASSYTWSTGSNSASIVVSPTVSTIYSLAYNAAMGCSDTLNFTQNVLTCTGVSEFYSKASVTIYPNPVTNTLYIKTDNLNLNGSEIRVLNYLGQIVLKQPFSEKIIVNNLSSGYYTIIVLNGNIEFRSKFIKY